MINTKSLPRGTHHDKPFNLIHQIQRVLNRHSEDPYFGNLVSALQNASSNSDIDDVIYETADSLCPSYYAELKV